MLLSTILGTSVTSRPAFANSVFTIVDPDQDYVRMVNGVSFRNNSFEIKSIDYNHNTTYLNATMRLFIDPIVFHDNWIFGLLLDEDTNPKTGLYGIDYQVDFKQQNRSDSGILTVKKFSTDGGSKVILNQSRPMKLVNRSTDGTYSVNLPAPLEKSSNYHRATFYALSLPNQESFFIDITNWNFIPQPIFRLILEKNSIHLKPGDEISLSAKIDSTIPMQSEVNLYPGSNQNLKVTIEPPRMVLNPHGSVSSMVRIKTPVNVSNDFLILPISARFTFPDDSAQYRHFKLADNVLIPNLHIQNLTTEETMTINFEKTTTPERFWALSFSDFISLGIGAIAIWASLPSIVSQFLSHFYKPKIEAFLPPNFQYNEGQRVRHSELNNLNIRNSELNTFQVVVEISIDKPWAFKSDAQGLYPESGLKGGYPLKGGFWRKTSPMFVSGNSVMGLIFPFIPDTEEAEIEIVIHPKIHISEFGFPSNYGEVYLKPIKHVFHVTA